MARRRSGRGPDYFWGGMSDSTPGIDLTEGTKVLGTTAFAFSQSQTLTRLRGDILVQLDSGGVDERATIALGIGVFPTDAVAAGVVSLPGPESDIGFPWVWHSYVNVSTLAEAAIASDFIAVRLVVDSKAMRRVKVNESLALVGEVAASVDQAGLWDLMYGVRILTAF